jgi:putative hemolysin
MDDWSSLQLFVFFLLVFLSGFFSSVEAAMYALSKMTLKRLLAREGFQFRLLHIWVNERSTLLNALYFANTVMRVGATVLATRLTINIARESGFQEGYALLIAVVCITLVLLLFGEAAPKTIAQHSPEKAFMILAPPTDLALTILRPFSVMFAWISRLVVAALGGSTTGTLSVTEAEIKEVVDAGQKDGAIEESEKKMIHSIIAMGDTMVKEVMVPRVDMVCVDVETPMEAILDLMDREKLSRIPVYENSLDTIVGIIHIKNIMNFWRRSIQEMHAIEFITMPHFVPETKRVSELIKEFQSKHMQMAIVVDEYGGTAGLVTMEDLVEEIVGEIQDEYDDKTPLIRQEEDGSYLVDAKVEIDEFNQRFHANLPRDEYHTIGGFVMWLLRRMPKKNETVSYGPVRLTVLEADRKRIHKLRFQMAAS